MLLNLLSELASVSSWICCKSARGGGTLSYLLTASMGQKCSQQNPSSNSFLRGQLMSRYISVLSRF